MIAEAFGLVGIVIVVATLLSGALERSGAPAAALFLLLGLALGPHALGVVHVGLGSPLLAAVAVLGLVLVLFVDAIGLDLAEMKSHAGLAARVLGPATLLSAAALGTAAWALLGLRPAEAAILGAALSSTDPVLLRGLLRRPDLPESARTALRLESALNDAVLLPIILVALALLGAAAGPSWARLALGVGLLGPAAGAAVGYLAVTLLRWVRAHTRVSRDYESLYSLGVALSAFAAGEALHASGFIAAFAAGLTIAALDVELCDCFEDYGATTAEMTLLITFVLFGASLIWTGLAVESWRELAFAAVALAARPLMVAASLWRSGLEPRARRFVIGFGPRGLSSLLLVLLPAFAGAPGAARLFQLCSLVVLASMVVHGATLVALRQRELAGLGAPVGADRITIEELRALRERQAPHAVGDVRTARSARDSDRQAAGAIRLDPIVAVDDARRLGLPRDVPIALYCS